MNFPEVCFDRIAQDTLYIPSNASRIALLKSKQFIPGSTLSYSFMGGNDRQRSEAQQAIEELMIYANINYKLAGSGGDTRISFDASAGAYSVLGTDIFTVPRNQATMNLGFNQPGTYLHEWCHDLGAIHEHQNPAGGIKWNKPQVRRDLSGPPNRWDRQTIEHNMFEAYSVNQLNGTEFDAKSIMLYSIPSRWTLDGFHSKANGQLSEMDKVWLSTQYPGRSVVIPGVTTTPPPDVQVDFEILPVIDLSARIGAISKPGEVDTIQIAILKSGVYRIENIGNTSVALRLFGPNSKNNLVGETNNIDTRDKAFIQASLNAGVYFLQVAHVNHGGVGSYALRALKLTSADVGDSVTKDVILLEGKYEVRKI